MINLTLFALAATIRIRYLDSKVCESLMCGIDSKLDTV